MNLTKCSQGHFYDADKFNVCPHCTPDSEKIPKTSPAGGINITDRPTEAKQNGNFRDNTHVLPDDQDGGSTQGGGLRDAVDKAGVTIGIFMNEKGKGPVVGWLVCTEGKHYGEDFRLGVGKNFIGRGNNMDVVLANDNSVSREKHSIVVYEPNERIFIVQSGDSKELSYLNGQIILSPQLLKPYDKIKLGATTLMFVPLCGEAFSWTIEEKEDKKV